MPHLHRTMKHIALAAILSQPVLVKNTQFRRKAVDRVVIHRSLIPASEEAINTIPHKLEIEYGPTPGQKLDILGTDLPNGEYAYKIHSLM